MDGLSREAKEFLRENFADADSLMKKNVREILEAIYDLIDERGFAPPDYYDYNDFGRKAQRIYDDIYLTE